MNTPFKIKNKAFNLGNEFNEFWCWSRMDHDNDKNIISIANVNIDDIFETFSFEFVFNGTHIKCQNSEKWQQHWTILPDDNFVVTCATSTFPAVTFYWYTRSSGEYDKYATFYT